MGFCFVLERLEGFFVVAFAFLRSLLFGFGAFWDLGFGIWRIAWIVHHARLHT
jgi:hypothetical protein